MVPVIPGYTSTIHCQHNTTFPRKRSTARHCRTYVNISLPAKPKAEDHPSLSLYTSDFLLNESSSCLPNSLPMDQSAPLALQLDMTLYEV